MSVDRYDIIIVGAGLAGLACAQKLIEARKKILILEGRDRIGGRVLPTQDNFLQAPLELGAEFIHGLHQSTHEPLTKMGSHIYDVQDSHHVWNGKKLQCMPHFWEDMEAMIQLLQKQNDEQSVQSFFDSTRKKISFRKMKQFRSFVEGFHSADLNKMSQKGLIESSQSNEKEELNGHSQFRPAQGYRPLILYYRQQINHSNLRLNAIVKKINWKKNQVRITTRSTISSEEGVIEAKKAVITVPVGVLKSTSASTAGIEWDPFPSDLKSFLTSVEMGDVQKIILKFKDRFWESLTEEPLGFVHLEPELYFPTWWTLMPFRLPFLIAWQGGPKAKEISSLPETERLEIALQSLAKWSQKPISFLQDQLIDFYTHNWTKDPFSLGAYSYILEGQLSRSKILDRAIENTLYFAGEGTVSGSPRGTVHGAVESGEKVANKILGERRYAAAGK